MAINRSIRNFGFSTSPYGEKIWLTEPDTFPQLLNPGGLGISESEDKKISFDFKAENYVQWFECSKLFSSNELYIWYSVPIPKELQGHYETEYLEASAKVKLKLFEKGEIAEMNLLNSTLEFEREENWQTITVRRAIIHNELSIGKVYEYAYPFTYIDVVSSTVFRNDSNVELPLDVIIKGTCSNPTIKLIDISTGETYAWVKLKDTLQEENDYFRINSDPTDHYIVKFVNGQIVNVWGSVDRNGGAILMLRTGDTRIVYENEVADHGDVEIAMRYEYNAI